MHTLLAASLLLLPLSAHAAALQDGDPQIPPDQGEVVATDSGLKYCVLEQGSGPQPKTGTKVRVHYSGWLTDGTLFDSSVKRGEPFEFPLGTGRVIPGWDEAVALMSKGSRYKLTIPPQLGYGERGAPPTIPPGATLVFEVQLLDFVVLPEFRQPVPAAQKRLESGLVYEEITAGQGDPPVAGEMCEVEYALFNTAGKLLDCSAMQSRNLKDTCGESRMAFMNEVLPLMRPGARWRLEVPPELAFGERAMGADLPAGSKTVWEVALVSIQKPMPLPEFSDVDAAKATTTASGLTYEVLRPGQGAKPRMGQNVTVHYAGWLTDGTLFDASYKRAEPASFQLGRVIAGWNEGLQLMAEGAVYRFRIPADQAYGKRGSPPAIPPDATLIFHVELIKVGP